MRLQAKQPEIPSHFISHKLKLLCFILALFIVLLPYLYSNPIKVNAFTSSSYVEQELLLLFEHSVNASEQTSIIKTLYPNATILERIDDYVLLKLPEDISLVSAIEAFSKLSQITCAEPNYLISKSALTDDTYSNTQWSLKNTGSYRSYFNGVGKKISSTRGIDLNVSTAWDVYNTSKGANEKVIVAILDTGVDINHEDLIDNIWINSNEIPDDGKDNDGNGYVDDVNGWDFYNNDSTVCHYSFDDSSNVFYADPHDNDDHGTHCAGIIGAVANNQTGIAGIASNINIELMPLKIQGGIKGSGPVSNAIKAIKYAEKMGAKVCNISWGSSQYIASLEQTIKESSMLFIAAAGNDGGNNDTSPIYPASFDLDNVISVTFVTPNGKLTSLSNYGKNTVDIAAPGYDIFSTTVGSSYGQMSGSSMAVPHISAVAAIIYASKANLYPQTVKELLLKYYTPLSSLSDKVSTPGIPNLTKLVRSVSMLDIDRKKPTLSLKTMYREDKIIVNLSSKDTGGSGIRVIKYLYGNHSLADFEKGTVGTSITTNELSVSKPGIYTFYISDYAGNEHKVVYSVVDDISAPTLSTSYTFSNNYNTINITSIIKDTDSGVKLVKYMKGNHTASDFKASSAGTKITSDDDTYTFRVSSSGTYTIYAIDYRGNKSISNVTIEIVKAQSLSLPINTKVLKVGSIYSLIPTVLPINTTDTVTYKSMNSNVASVSKNGTVAAKSQGRTTIVVTTTSGKKTSLLVTVT